MKRVLFAMMVLISLVIAAGCSDGQTVASYKVGTKVENVTVKDVKKELAQYVSYDNSITTNFNWHKDYLFGRHMALGIVFNEEAASGFTNTPDYTTQYDTQIKKQELIALYQAGQADLKKQSETAKVELVKAAHILIMAGKTTNINGKVRDLTEAEFNALLQEKENKALNIIETLKQAKNLDKEFSNVAVSTSEDGGSAVKGGDLGYFTRGMMVPEFEAASFTATKKGLITTPVKTTYGYHIIYVQEPALKLSSGAIKSKLGKNYDSMKSYFQNSFFKSNKEETVKANYTVDNVAKTITVDGVAYKSVDSIPADAKILIVNKKPYTWKEAMGVFQIMIPTFMADLKTVTVEALSAQMGNLENFLPFVAHAQAKKLDKTANYKKEMEDFKKNAVRNMAAQSFEKKLLEQVKSSITTADIKKQYDENKAAYTKNVNNKPVQMSFNEAQDRIKSELEGTKMRDAYSNWTEQMKTKYKVSYNNSGIKALMSIEKGEVKKAEAKRKEYMKKLQSQEKKKKPAENK